MNEHDFLMSSDLSGPFMIIWNTFLTYSYFKVITFWGWAKTHLLSLFL